MNDAKYIGMDVHTATISTAVRDSSGNLVREATIETRAETILEFVHGLRGSVRVSFEEGICASWLHDLLKPHVSEVLVCDSRKNALLRVGNKNDREESRLKLWALQDNDAGWKISPSKTRGSYVRGAAGLRKALSASLAEDLRDAMAAERH